MSRRQNRAVYSANWHITPEQSEKIIHRIHYLELTVSLNERSALAYAFRATKKEIPIIQGFLLNHDAELSVLHIPVRKVPTTEVERDHFGRTFIRYYEDMPDLFPRTDLHVARYLNKVAAIFGYPPVTHFKIDRRYDVRKKIQDKMRWVDEGWWLAQSAEGKM